MRMKKEQQKEKKWNVTNVKMYKSMTPRVAYPGESISPGGVKLVGVWCNGESLMTPFL